MPSYGTYGMPEAVKLYQALTQHNQIIYQLLARYLCRCNTKFATKVIPWGQPCHSHWLISEPARYTNKILKLKQSSSDMCSAIPTALLCMIVFGNEWEQGTNPKGLEHRGWFKCSTGRPRAICGQQYPLPCFSWLWIGVRGSRAAAQKGTMSSRTQGDFRSSCLKKWMRCYGGLTEAFKSLRMPI